MEACSRYNRMLDSVKSDYFKAKIDQAGNRRLFKPVDWLFTLGSPGLPTIYDSLDSLSKNSILGTKDSEPQEWVRGNF